MQGVVLLLEVPLVDDAVLAGDCQCVEVGAHRSGYNWGHNRLHQNLPFLVLFVDLFKQLSSK